MLKLNNMHIVADCLHYGNECTSYIMKVSKVVYLVSVLIQVVPLYVLMFFLAAHVYINPYKHWFENAITALTFLNYCVLLMLRFPHPILDALANYSGIMVPSEYGQELPKNDNLTLLFSPWFYFPLALGVVTCIILLIKRTR